MLRKLLSIALKIIKMYLKNSKHKINQCMQNRQETGILPVFCIIYLITGGR